MTDISRILHIGNRYHGNGAAPAFQSHPLDLATDGIAVTFRARDTNPITHVGWRYGARTGTPPTYRLALEGRDTMTGEPDGTPLGGGSPASMTTTPPADGTQDGLFLWFALANAYTPTLGELITSTIRYSSGTVDGSNFSSWTSHVTNLSGGAGFPKAWRLTGGSWTATGNAAIFGIRTASSRYGIPIQSFYNTRTASTVGHRAAMKFALASGVAASYGIGEAHISGSLASAADKTPIMGLWSASAALQSTTLNTNDHVNAASSYFLHETPFDDSPSALTPGTNYYLGNEVVDAAGGGVLINGIQLADAADRDAFDGAANCCLSTYNGTSWTDDETVVPMVDATLYDLTAAAGSGGVVIAG